MIYNKILWPTNRCIFCYMTLNILNPFPYPYHTFSITELIIHHAFYFPIRCIYIQTIYIIGTKYFGKFYNQYFHPFIIHLFTFYFLFNSV